MRIFYVGQKSAQANVTSSRIWEINILDALQASHEVLQPTQYINIFDVTRDETFNSEAFLQSNSEILYAEVAAAHAQKPIDLFLSYFYTENILSETIERIKVLGIVTMNMYFNGIHQFDLIEKLAPVFDYCLVPEAEAMSRYEQIGARPLRFPMAANPNFYKPYPSEKQYDVVFIGSRYLNREAYLAYLYNHGITVDVFGLDWLSEEKPATKPVIVSNKLHSLRVLLQGGSLQEIVWVLKRNLRSLYERIRTTLGMKRPALPRSCIHGPLSDEDMVRLYSQAKVILNFSETIIFDRHNRGNIRNIIKLRDFEVPMSGGFAITGYQEELKEYYTIGTEIVCYRSKRDLLRKIRYYLTHAPEREAIAKAGRERALRDHTWEKHFENVFKQANLI